MPASPSTKAAVESASVSVALSASTVALRTPRAGKAGPRVQDMAEPLSFDLEELLVVAGRRERPVPQPHRAQPPLRVGRILEAHRPGLLAGRAPSA